MTILEQFPLNIYQKITNTAKIYNKKSLRTKAKETKDHNFKYKTH